MSNEAYAGYPKPERLERYVKDYGDYHAHNPKKLSGKFPAFQIGVIASLVARIRACQLDDWRPRLLDYGSGKGYQYLAGRAQDAWGGFLPICYDPGVVQICHRPTGKFDGIICTDVLEHIETIDLPDVLADIFGLIETNSPAFIYLHACCRPANKSFPDGRNLHATIESPKFWKRLIEPYAVDKPNLILETTYEGVEDKKPGQLSNEHLMGTEVSDGDESSQDDPSSD